jgi:hypothetical protein
VRPSGGGTAGATGTRVRPTIGNDDASGGLHARTTCAVTDRPVEARARLHAHHDHGPPDQVPVVVTDDVGAEELDLRLSLGASDSKPPTVRLPDASVERAALVFGDDGPD